MIGASCTAEEEQLSALWSTYQKARNEELCWSPWLSKWWRMHTSSLQPPPPPQVNPSWLCYPVLMSVRSPLLPCSALFLTASQTHAVTQPRSACLLAASPLGPRASRSLFLPLPRSSVPQPTGEQAANGWPSRGEARQASRQDAATHSRVISSAAATSPRVFRQHRLN